MSVKEIFGSIVLGLVVVNLIIVQLAWIGMRRRERNESEFKKRVISTDLRTLATLEHGKDRWRGR